MNEYNIMILDDDEEGTALLAASLEEAGLPRIETASDPEEALSRFHTRKYHVLLVDMDMQKLDGLEILRFVRQYDPMTQVIMMTERSTIDRALACLELGASDYVLKPFRSDDEIMESVADAIRRLERWKGVIRETVLRLSDSSALSHPN